MIHFSNFIRKLYIDGKILTIKDTVSIFSIFGKGIIAHITQASANY